MPKPTILLDGDVFVYQVGLSVEKPTDWGDDLWTLHADFNEAKTLLNAKINRLKEVLEADEVRIALSCPTEEGFRRQLVASYKSNRTGNRKPIVHRPLRQYLIDELGATVAPRLEADDLLGIWATTKSKKPTILASIDKDFRGVPCEFYKLSQYGDNAARETITEEAASHWHALQTLMGDRVDGYAGVPGVGVKTAEKILSEVTDGNYWPVIKAAYEDAGLSEEVALENARLARILRHGGYNFRTNKIKLWTP